MANNTLSVDLHLDHKIGSQFSLLCNADNFNTDEIGSKLRSLINQFGENHQVSVNKFCFYANGNRLNPVHVVRLDKLTNLSLVLYILLLVTDYAEGDELRMNTVLGVFEHTNIPVELFNKKHIDEIVAITYYVRDNYKENKFGIKEDLRDKSLIYREVGRGICIGMFPTHPFQTQKIK